MARDTADQRPGNRPELNTPRARAAERRLQADGVEQSPVTMAVSSIGSRSPLPAGLAHSQLLQ